MTVDRCAKPGCSGGGPVDRHHKAHEALWFAPWAHREHGTHYDRAKWKQFVQRYAEFRESDIVRLCRAHHTEIHAIYDAIIADDVAKTGMRLYLYSWKQGRILMQRLTDACDKWLTQITAGLDSDYYERTKERRREKLEEEAQLRYNSEKSEAVARMRAARIRRKRTKRDPSGS